MPTALVDVVAVGALVALLVVAFAHPRGRVEVASGLAAVVAVLAVGAVSWQGAREQVDLMLPVVLFLGAILVVAEACAAEGLFVAVGRLVRGRGRSDARRVLTLAFVAAAVITAVLSLDATVVLLTPAVVLAALGSRSVEAVSHVCVRLANSASLIFPVSNLTNLLALPWLSLTFTGFAAAMLPVWLAVLAVEYVGIRLFFRRDLADPLPRSAGSADDPEGRPLRRAPVVVVAAMLVGFAVGSPFGVEPFWVAGAAAVVLVLLATRDGRLRGADVLRAAHLPFLGFVLCLGVVVAGVTGSFLGEAVRHLVPHDTGFAGLLGIAVLATLLANLVNNLPATLLLVPLVAPLGSTAVLAALVGLNVGSGLTYTGSLANLLWRRTLVRHHEPPSTLRFHLHALAVTPVAVVVAVAVLAR